MGLLERAALTTAVFNCNVVRIILVALSAEVSSAKAEVCRHRAAKVALPVDEGISVL